MTKEIWLPIAETRATVAADGRVTTWLDMKMTPQSISTPIGFRVSEVDDAS